MTVCKTYQASQVTTSSRVALHVPIASLWFCTLPQVLTRAFQSKYQVFETVFAKTNDVVSVIGTSGRSLSELTSFPITVSRFTMHWSIVSSAGETMYVRGRRFDVWASSLLIHLQMTTSFFFNVQDPWENKRIILEVSSGIDKVFQWFESIQEDEVFPCFSHGTYLLQAGSDFAVVGGFDWVWRWAGSRSPLLFWLSDGTWGGGGGPTEWWQPTHLCLS